MKPRPLIAVCLCTFVVSVTAAAREHAAPTTPMEASVAAQAPEATLLASGLAGGSGSTVGPGGALFVTEAVAGRVSRIDPRTGAATVFASGLPPRLVGTGGAMDIAFIGSTAYVLVTLVGPDVGGGDVVGIYRIDGPNTFTVIADIGAFSLANPPPPGTFFVPTGVQYALEVWRHGFLVTDGHHNRVLSVALDGTVTETATFGNIVPTGLATWGNRVLMAEAGPVPHLPQHGKVVTFSPGAPTATEIAAGARLAVDVEFGLGRSLFALSQGVFTPGNPEGSPADPDTGALLRVNGDGTMTPIIGGLDRPTSMEFIGHSAYVVTLDGEVWKIDNVFNPPFGRP
jgi:sugar lactone lactonase YvrE